MPNWPIAVQSHWTVWLHRKINRSELVHTSKWAPNTALSPPTRPSHLTSRLNNIPFAHPLPKEAPAGSYLALVS